MASKKYIAYHFDLQGAAQASYELKAADDDSALSEARQFLKDHSSIEVWQSGRGVGRIIKPEPT